MKRYTTKMDQNQYSVEGSEILHQEDKYVGEAINQLAAYENMYEALVAEQESISKEMENLRIQGKTKTVTFKQLMAKKLTNTNILSLFEVYRIDS